MKRSFINKKNIIIAILFGFSIIFPIFSYENIWIYFGQLGFYSIMSYAILQAFSFSKNTRIWGLLRLSGILLSLVFFVLMANRFIMSLNPKNIGWVVSNPIDDERFIKSLYAFLFSLVVLGVGEIIIYLRDIRFLLSLNKNNKDYFECDDCEGKGFIEKDDEDELTQKNCRNCSGLGFLEKNSNNWFPRK